MTIRPILNAPNKILKSRSLNVPKVNDEIIMLLTDMLETMYNDDGIGLAAVQIGILKRVIVVDVTEQDTERKPLKLINPEIVWKSSNHDIYEEGCLSFPNYFAKISRATEIKIKYLNEKENIEELTASGILAVCIQHEIDHLDGKLFIDHLSLVKRNIILRKIAKARRVRDIKD
tara:strand:+ start:52 stop:573 length:522 start_codon:yes stop_codon:yes gene_type:complete